MKEVLSISDSLLSLLGLFFVAIPDIGTILAVGCQSKKNKTTLKKMYPYFNYPWYKKWCYWD